MSKANKAGNPSVSRTPPNDAAQGAGDLRGRRCSLRNGKGITLLVVGILIMIAAALFAAGLWGAGAMYIVAGGLTLVAILPLAAAAFLLRKKKSAPSSDTA
ncbi:MAG: hypothetical protein KR126chlam2_00039 [Chlamydiae bacterium]|nr:hypothetical protein [Chlamydiota bacterium]